MLDNLFRLIAFGSKYFKNCTLVIVLILFLIYHVNELIIRLVICLKYDNDIVGLKNVPSGMNECIPITCTSFVKESFLKGFTCIV